MDNLFSIVQRLCKSRSITIAALERACGFGNGTVKKWGTATPSGDRLAKVADYFNVTVDYLLGRNEIEETYVPHTIAAHFDGDEFTKSELDEIVNYIEYVKSKKNI
ncbi:MAG: helix-turn-helix domain-containing protein [Velocimicrobium sp.]